MRSQLVFILLYILTAWPVAAQRKPVLSGSVQGGFLVAHRSNIKHLVQGHTLGGQIQLEWLSDGSRAWHAFYGNPSAGLEAAFSGTGNPDEMGYLASAHGFVRLPLSQGGTGTPHHLYLGMGAGYATRIWDLDENVRAPVLGSHLNASLLLQYEWRIPLSTSFALRTGIRMHHMSNGSYQLPNLGTNVASLYLGLTPRRTAFLDSTAGCYFPSERRWAFSLNVATGIKEIQDPLGDKFMVLTLGCLAHYQVSYKSSFSLGVDMFLNRSMITLLGVDDGQATLADQVLSGISAGYGLHFDQWTFRVMMGYYLMDPWGGYGDWYHRFGLRYWFNDRLFAQFMLKTHFAKADYGEWGLGIRIGK